MPQPIYKANVPPGGGTLSFDYLTVEPTAVANPFWQTTDDGKTARLYLGHVTDVLAKMPAGVVQTVVTSPPYWGLRDYGTAEWEGGQKDCDHLHNNAGDVEYLDRNGVAGSNNTTWQGAKRHATAKLGENCKKCGAFRIDSQLGSEPSPDCGTQGQAQCGRCFVCSMVAVFRGVRRVLRDDGTLWLNLGDTYESDGNLVGIPWRVALALQADGWILRQDIIWHKPSPMPESVRNRCTKAHEYVFLLAKGPRYYCDMEAVKEMGPSSNPRGENRAVIKERADNDRMCLGEEGERLSNKRSVWKVASFGYPGAHFATYPPKLIEPCILAGTSAKGCCAKCKTPWKRVTEERAVSRERPNDYVKRVPGGLTTEKDMTKVVNGIHQGGVKSSTLRMSTCSNTVAGVEVKTIGWQPGCSCGGWEMGRKKPDPVPCLVLDPFVGSGTTGEVSLEHGRSFWGVDLSEKYLRENAVPRISSVLCRPALRHLIPTTRNPSPNEE